MNSTFLPGDAVTVIDGDYALGWTEERVSPEVPMAVHPFRELAFPAPALVVGNWSPSAEGFEETVGDFLEVAFTNGETRVVRPCQVSAR